MSSGQRDACAVRLTRAKALLQVHGDKIDEDTAIESTGIVAVWIALCLSSDRPWLFAAGIDSCIDGLCSGLGDKALTTASVLIDGIRNLGDGGVVCASIGNRTPVSQNSHAEGQS